MVRTHFATLSRFLCSQVLLPRRWVLTLPRLVERVFFMILVRLLPPRLTVLTFSSVLISLPSIARTRILSTQFRLTTMISSLRVPSTSSFRLPMLSARQDPVQDVRTLRITSRDFRSLRRLPVTLRALKRPSQSRQAVRLELWLSPRLFLMTR